MVFAKSKRFASPLLMLGLLAWLLTACGTDNPTAAPATTGPATTAATTSSATTAAAAGAAATTSAATTAATTTAATTSVAASGTVSAATTAAATISATTVTTATTTSSDPANQLVATTPGLTPLSLSSSVASALKNQLKAPQAIVTFYGSNDDDATVGDNLDKTLTGGNYQIGIPGQSKPLTSNGITIGLYNSKTGGKDILFITTAIPATVGDVNDATAGASVASTGIPGLTSQELQQSLSQLKGKKTLVLVISGDNLLSNLTALGTGSAATTPASGSPTPAPTPKPTA